MTCVRHIRELQREGQITNHVPVIAVTANARQDQILACIEAGMVSFPPHNLPYIRSPVADA